MTVIKGAILLGKISYHCDCMGVRSSSPGLVKNECLWSNTLAPEQMTSLIMLIQRWDETPAGMLPAPNIPIPVTEESLTLGSQAVNLSPFSNTTTSQTSAGQQASPWLDWRVLLLVGIVLSIAFTLTSCGLASFRMANKE